MAIIRMPIKTNWIGTQNCVLDLTVLGLQVPHFYKMIIILSLSEDLYNRIK